MIEVESSMLDAIDYDPASLTLKIRFKKGGQTFAYVGVRGNVYTEMLESESIGKYFHSTIKGKYEYSKVEEVDSNDGQ